MEIKRPLASVVLAALLLAEAHLGVLPGLSVSLTDKTSAATTCQYTYSSTNLIQNGSFEDPVVTAPEGFQIVHTLPGWTLPQSWVEIQRDGLQLDQGVTASTPNGNQWAELDVVNVNQLVQDVATTPSRGIKISFQWSPRPAVGHQEIEVSWNGQLLGTLSGNGNGRTREQWQTATFTAETGTRTDGRLLFRTIAAEADGRGMLIDDVRVLQSTNGCTQCSDNIDNDGDGAKDENDFSCSGPDDNDETNPKAACQDGVDNDGDGKVDFPNDPGCESKQDNDEFNAPTPQCRDGIDNDGDGATDSADFSCSNSDDNDETNPKSQCQDGVDNDGDGLVDAQDPGCTNNQDNDESPVNTASFQITDTVKDATVRQGDVAVFVQNIKNTGTLDANSTLRIHNIFLDAQGNVIQNLPFTFESNTNTSVATCAPHPNADHRIVCELTSPLTAGMQRTFGVRYDVSSETLCGQTITHKAEVRITPPNSDQQVVATDTATITVQCSSVPQCSDGIDNDGDGATDYPADFSCSGPNDNDETNPKAACQDGQDNDGDGLIDFPQDPGCSSKQDNDETNQGSLNFTAVKSADKTSIKPGQMITYTIVVKNMGTASAPQIRIIDPVPAGLMFISSTTGCYLHNSGLSVQCPFESYAPGQTRTHRFTMKLVPTAACGDGKVIDNVADLQYPNSNGVGNTSFVWSNHHVTPITCNDPVPQCSDGIDNDGDGLIDFPNDPGCDNATDNDESNPTILNFSAVKTADKTVVQRGEIITYTIQVKNLSSATATEIRIRDNVPAGTTFVSASDAACFLKNNGTDPQAIFCPFETYAPGQMRSYMLKFRVNQNATCSSVIDNVADVQKKVGTGPHNSFAWSNHAQTTVQCAQVYACSDGIDNDADGLIDFPNDPGCDSATDNDEFNTTTQKADLSIAKAGVAQIVRGHTIAYTLSVYNLGPNTAQNVTVTDPIPVGLNFNATLSDASCVQKSNAVVCELSSLAAGASKTLTIALTAPVVHQCAETVVYNTATVSSSTLDLNTANNTSQTVSTTVKCPVQVYACSDGIDNDGDGLIDFPNDPGCDSATDNDEFNSATQKADMFIHKSGTPSAVKRGETVTYTLQVGNGGTATAENVVVTDTFPSDLHYVSASGATCTLSGSTVRCALGSMGPQDVVKVITLAFTAKAQSACTQNVTVTNTAAVSTTSSETSVANNTSFAQTTINCAETNAAADLSIVKTGPNSLTYGQNVTYTLTVKNNSTVTASNVLVTDTYPGQMVYLAGSSSSQCTLNGNNTVRCSLASLAGGQETAFTLVFQIGDPPVGTTSTTVTNTATVSAATNDPNTSNNTSSVTSTLSTQTGTLDQLSIYKTDGRSSAYTTERLRYIITVNNSASSTVNSVTVTDNVPSGLTIISVSDGGSINGQTVTWSNLSFASYQSRTFYIDAEIQSSLTDGTVITNTATVGSKQATDQTTIKKIPTYEPPTYNPPNYPPVYYPPVRQPPVYYPPVNQPPVYYPPVSQPPAYYPPVSQPKYTPPIYVYPETGAGDGALYGEASETDALTAVADQSGSGAPFTAAFYATLLTMLAAGSAAATKFLAGGGMFLG